MPSTQRSTSPPPAGAAPPRGRIGGLDGLRAIAVAVVLVYHLMPGLLPGGMVGVDAFFVISGFLITSLLLVERRTTGRIDVRRFWIRRLRRIVPALLVAVAATVAAAACLGGDVLLAVRRQVLGSVLLVYNWVEIAAGSSYFDQTQPLLLTNVWSLAVEEQFYLLWPLVIVAFLSRGPSWTRRRFAALALGLSVASAAWALHLMGQGESSSRVYMGTDTHAFGLMMGSALALWHGRATEGLTLTPQRPELRRARGLLGWAGLAGLLIVACVSDGGAMAQPGGLGPVPALIIASVCALAVVQALTGEVALAAGPAQRLSRLLQAGPLQWVGSRSYGLYLWHWPLGVLAFYAIPPTANPRVVALGVLGLTLCAAELSHSLIETPVRRDGLLVRLRRVARLRPRQMVPAGGGATALVLLLVLAFASQPAQSAAQQAIAVGTGYLSAPSAVPATAVGAPTQDPSPEQADPFTGGEVVVVGDSVTIAAAPSLEADLPGVAVNAEVSRSVYAALPALQAMDAGGARPCVVIALATNGSVETDQLDAILSYLGPDRGLVLVTAHGPARTTWIPPANETIRAFARAHPDQVAVADWDAAVAARPDLLLDDQVHPVPEGGELYAQTVTDAVADLRRQPAS